MLPCGAEKENPIIKLMLDYYYCVDFKTHENWQDYINNQETNTWIMSNILGLLGVNRKDKHSIQKIKHFTVYPQSYFFTKGEGYTWHSFSGSWRIMFELCMRFLCKLCPKKLECDKKLEEERLMYKPFENLKELMRKKDGNSSR